MIGERYERLVVIADHRRYLTVRCDCGTEKEIRRDQFTCRRVKSCGCLARETKSPKVRTMDAPMDKCPVWARLVGQSEPRHRRAAIADA